MGGGVCWSGRAQRREHLRFSVARVRSCMAIDLPTGACEFTAMSCGVFAHSVMGESQLPVVAAVRRGRYLSGGKRRRDHDSVGLEWPRYENTDLDVRSLVLIEH